MIARRMIDFPAVEWQNPFVEMKRMVQQMDHLTNAVFSRPGMRFFSSKVFPAVNITQDKDKYYVRAELPGIKSDEIELKVNGKKLMVSGERQIHFEGQDARYHRREREAGKFSRVIELPGDIDADRVLAKMVNGMLTVEIAKSEASKPKRITVH